MFDNNQTLIYKVNRLNLNEIQQIQTNYFIWIMVRQYQQNSNLTRCLISNWIVELLNCIELFIWNGGVIPMTRTHHGYCRIMGINPVFFEVNFFACYKFDASFKVRWLLFALCLAHHNQAIAAVIFITYSKKYASTRFYTKCDNKIRCIIAGTIGGDFLTNWK